MIEKTKLEFAILKSWNLIDEVSDLTFFSKKLNDNFIIYDEMLEKIWPDEDNISITAKKLLRKYISVRIHVIIMQKSGMSRSEVHKYIQTKVTPSLLEWQTFLLKLGVKNSLAHGHPSPSRLINPKKKNPEKIEITWAGISRLLNKNITARIKTENGLFFINSVLNFTNIRKPRFEISYPNKKQLLLKGYSSFQPNLVEDIIDSPSGFIINLKSSDIKTEDLREIYHWKDQQPPKEGVHLVINEDYFQTKGSSGSHAHGKLNFNSKNNFFYMKIQNNVFCSFKKENIYKIDYNIVYVNI